MVAMLRTDQGGPRPVATNKIKSTAINEEVKLTGIITI